MTTTFSFQNKASYTTIFIGLLFVTVVILLITNRTNRIDISNRTYVANSEIDIQSEVYQRTGPFVLIAFNYKKFNLQEADINDLKRGTIPKISDSFSITVDSKDAYEAAHYERKISRQEYDGYNAKTRFNVPFSEGIVYIYRLNNKQELLYSLNWSENLKNLDFIIVTPEMDLFQFKKLLAEKLKK